MTSEERIYNDINEGNSGKTNINLIYKTNNSITKVKEYIYKYDRNSDLNDLSKQITEEKIFDLRWKNSIIICSYDDDTTAQIIENLSERNRGMIDWNINIREYPLIKYIKCLNDFYPNKTLTVWCEECQTGFGSSGGSIIMSLKILKIIYNWVIPICIKLFLFFNRVDMAYKKLEEVTGYNKNFIKLVITKSHIWNKNFITDYYFSEKSKLEKKIMKNLNYKYNKKTKTWTSW